MEEGYIKFRCIKSDYREFDIFLFDELNRYRKILYDNGLIGILKNGIGFGNISARLNKDEFVITATGTGGIRDLDKYGYTVVTGYDIEHNTVWCSGKAEASSESLTHAAVYGADSDIKAVVHVHSKKLWEKYINILATTSEKTEYGTPEMALEIENLVKNVTGTERIIIMGGHKEGIITFGYSTGDAVSVLMDYINKIK